MIKSLINCPVKAFHIMTWIRGVLHYNVLIVNLKFFYTLNPFLKLRVGWVVKWEIVLISGLI